MIGMDEAQSRALHTRLLGNQYPHIKEQLNKGETLLAVSDRKPLRITGSFCIIVGIFFAADIIMFFTSSYLQWILPGLLLCAVSIWAGVRLAILISKEYVFVTDSRISYQKVNLLGRLAKAPLSIPLSEISTVRQFGNTSVSKTNSMNGGDILIKKKGGGTHLIPKLKDSRTISEIVVSELEIIRARHEHSDDSDES